jgi:hypothetical protein
MDDPAEIALIGVREDAAAGAVRPFGADEELADGGVVAFGAGHVPGPPAGVVGIGRVLDQGDASDSPPARGRGGGGAWSQ